MAVKAASLLVDIRAGLAHLQSDMDQAHRTVEQGVKKIQGALELLGVAASGYAFVSLIKGALDFEDSLSKLSERLGISTEELSAWQGAAKLAGVEADEMTVGMRKLAKVMADAAGGLKEQQAIFDAMHINIYNANGGLKTQSEMLRIIADKFASYNNGIAKTALGQELLGRSGEKLIPLFNRGAQEVDRLTQMLEKMGGIVTPGAAEAAEVLNDSWTEMHMGTEALTRQFVDRLVPGMQAVTNDLLEMQRAADRHWIDDLALSLGTAADMLRGLAQTALVVAGNFGLMTTAVKYGFAALSIIVTGGDAQTRAQALEQLAADYRKEQEINLKRLDGQIDFGSKYADAIRKSMDDPLRAWTEKQREFSKKAAELQKLMQDETLEHQRGAMKLLAENIFGGPKTDAPTPARSPDSAKLAEIKKYESALQAMEMKLGSLNKQSEVEQLNIKLTTGSLKDLTKEHKAALVEKAKELDTREQSIALLKMEGEYYAALTVTREALNAQVTAGFEADSNARDDMEFELGLIGKTVDEQRRLTAVRQIDLALRAQLHQAAVTAGDDMEAYDRAAAALVRAANEQKAFVLNNVNDRIAAERSWQTGASAAIDEYVTNMSNAATQARDMWGSAFKSMEDTLTNFFMTGELKVKDFVKSMLAQLARLASQKIVLQIAGSVGLAGTAGTAAASAGGAMGTMSTLSSLGNMFSNGASGITGAANGVFQDIGVKLGSQWIADIGNYGFGLPFISGLAMAATGNVAGGIGSTLGGIAGSYFGPIGTVVGSTLGGMIGGLFGGGESRQAQALDPHLLGKVSRAGYSGAGIETMLGTAPNDYWGGSTITALPKDVLASFNAAIGEAFTSMEKQAKALSLDTSRLSEITVQAAHTGQGAQADMAATIAATSDEIAKTLIPNIAALQQSGESLTETFVRVTNAQIAYKAEVARQKRDLEIQIMELSGDAVGALAARRQDELAALDATLRPLQEQIYKLQDTATNAGKAAAALDTLNQQLDTVRTALKDAVDVQVSASSQASQAARSLAGTYRNLATTMLDTIRQLTQGALSPLLPGEKLAAARGTLESVFSSAKAGNVDAISKLPQVATDFLNASRAYNASSAAYTADFNRVTYMLAEAQSASVAGADAQDHLANVADAQLAILGNILDALKAPSPDVEYLREQVRLLGSIDTFSDSQLSALVTGNVTQGNTLTSIASLLEKLVNAQSAVETGAAAVAAETYQTWEERFTAYASSLYTPEQQAAHQVAYQKYGWTDDGSGDGYKGYYTAYKFDLAWFDQQMAAWKEQNPMPSHALGLRRVPYDGYEAKLHANEAVLNARDAASWRSGGAGITAEDLAALRQEMRDVRYAVEQSGAVNEKAVMAQTRQLAGAVEESATTMGRAVVRATEASKRA